MNTHPLTDGRARREREEAPKWIREAFPLGSLVGLAATPYGPKGVGMVVHHGTDWSGSRWLCHVSPEERWFLNWPPLAYYPHELQRLLK